MESWHKRPFDLIVLAAAHLALAPIWLVLWGVIPGLILLIDGGPVFYSQMRAGKDGKPFRVFKFRTMVRDADAIGPAWNVEGDPRVKRFGQLLRRTALDELPSLVNILKGDMSFVGPRALSVDEQEILERTIPRFHERLRVRPGLTGLAQVMNCKDAPDDKLRYDIEYINRMSLWLDIRIILMSVRNTLLGRWDVRTGKNQPGEKQKPAP